MTSRRRSGSGRVDHRLVARRRQVREDKRRRRLRRTVTIVGAVALAALLAVVERSPLVALTEVEIHGTQRLDPVQVRNAAALEPGTSTLRLRLGEVEQRVQQLPLVADVEARRIDPLSVAITVSERVPALEVRASGEIVLMDRDGVVLAEGGDDALPRIELTSAQGAPAPGERATEVPALGNAHLVHRGLSGPLRAQVERYVAAGPQELTLELERGTDVAFGAAERLEEKVQALGAVLQDVGDTELARIDVRAPAAPVVERRDD